MKKTILWSLILCFVLSILPFNTSATEIIESGKCGDNAEWTLYSDGLLIISGTGSIYGDSHEGVSPFLGDDRIVRVQIRDGITVIGRDAFFDCAELSSIEIPDSVKVIGSRAFYECKNLREIMIPAGVTDMEEAAFEGCSALKEVNIPSGVKAISNYLFHCCSSLQEVSIPDGVEIIGRSAFAMCQSLERVVIPESISEIKREAFYLCSLLSEISLKTKTARIGSDAFAGCFHLQDILYIGNAIEWEKLDSNFSDGKDDIRIHYNVKDDNNHIRISKIVEPTCSSSGYSLFSCDCGYENEMCRITYSMTNHNWDSGVVTIAPTETREGVKTYTCILCGSTKKETIPRLAPSDQSIPFTDVVSGVYYYDPIIWAVNHDPQITNGTGINIFSPDDTCTRGQVVTFLWRAEGCPEPKSSSNPFEDVKEGASLNEKVKVR